MATASSGIRACVFDAYGMLFDYASAAAGCRDVLGDRIDPLTALCATSSCNTLGSAGSKAYTRISGG